MKTLDEFIQSLDRNAYVKEPGFESLYVRHAVHLIGRKLEKTLDIANVTAKHPGKGTFTKLVERLRHDYPGMSIFVESVLNERFVEMLPRLGFVLVERSNPPSFFLRGLQSDPKCEAPRRHIE